jgi:hypothetical protein
MQLPVSFRLARSGPFGRRIRIAIFPLLVVAACLAGAGPLRAQAPAPISLFNGTDTSQLMAVSGGGPVPWNLVGPDILEVLPGTGNIQSISNYNDFILHAEFRIPSPPDSGNGNSGIFLQGRYEVQIFNSFGVAVPTGNDCGAIWNQRAASTNACRAPGNWQTYDITFRAAQWNGYSKIANAKVTVVLNGVTVQNNVDITTSTTGGALESPTPGPIVLQDNNSVVQFRNITIRPLNTPPPVQTTLFTSFKGSRVLVKAVKTDAAGNIYAAGAFTDTATFGPTNLVAAGTGYSGRDAFLARLQPDGTVVWALPFGGAGIDEAFDLALTPNGEPVIVGTFNGPMTFGTNTFAGTGLDDIFVAQFDANGQAKWIQTAGGAGIDTASGIATDASGNVYITGSINGSATFGTTNVTAAFSGVPVLYTAKYDMTGALQWVRLTDDPGGSSGARVALDPAGNVFVGGYFSVSLSHGTYVLRSSGGRDVLVLKYDANGNPSWAARAGGGNNDEVYGLATDPSGNILISGYFVSSASFGAINLNSQGKNGDIFVAKLNPNASFIWARQAGGIYNDNQSQVGNVATDPAGNVYLTASSPGDVTFSSIVLPQLGYYGYDDALAAKYDRLGNIIWAQRYGSSSTDANRALTVDATGKTITGGIFMGAATVNGTALNNLGGDGFLITVPSAPPQFTVQPQPATIDSGTTLTLSGAATTFGTAYFQWTLNGTNLPGATNATYLIANAALNNSGTYRLVVSDNFGVNTSVPADVIVQLLGVPQILSQPLDALVTEGSRVTFSVSAKGAPPLSYQWLYNGAPIPDATNTSYTTPQLAVGDSGNFTVTISNSFGITPSRAAVLTVVGIPEITTPLGNLIVPYGSNVTLTVGATGGALTYAWLFNNRLIIGATGPTLSIPNATTAESGGYRVIVGNPAGLAVVSDATLAVDPTPIITTHPQPQAALLGAAVNLSVSAIGEPPLSFQWRLNGTDIPGANSSTLAIPAANGTNAGDYTVLVSNLAIPSGVLSSNATLRVTGPQMRLGVGGGQATLTFVTPAGAFLLECTDGFGPGRVWTLIADLSTNAGNTISIPADPTAGPRFYRLRTP